MDTSDNLPLNKSFVISGPAALVCAETLRQHCYQGRIIMVTKDSLPPFDKPKLSKVRTQSEWRGSLYLCVFVAVADHPALLSK